MAKKRGRTKPDTRPVKRRKSVEGDHGEFTSLVNQNFVSRSPQLGAASKG